MAGNYYIYMLTNRSHRVLYTGMTNDLERRLHEHRRGEVPGFASRYNATKLVYYEHGYDVLGAIAREKQIKGWLRSKKNQLIETVNPEWNDLFPDPGDPSLRSG